MGGASTLQSTWDANKEFIVHEPEAGQKQIKVKIKMKKKECKQKYIINTVALKRGALKSVETTNVAVEKKTTLNSSSNSHLITGSCTFSQFQLVVFFLFVLFFWLAVQVTDKNGGA